MKATLRREPVTDHDLICWLAEDPMPQFCIYFRDFATSKLLLYLVILPSHHSVPAQMKRALISCSFSLANRSLKQYCKGKCIWVGHRSEFRFRSCNVILPQSWSRGNFFNMFTGLLKKKNTIPCFTKVCELNDTCHFLLRSMMRGRMQLAHCTDADINVNPQTSHRKRIKFWKKQLNIWFDYTLLTAQLSG